MSREAPGFFDVDERLAELSAKGDDLERLNAFVDFELFRGNWRRQSRVEIVRKAGGRHLIRC